MLPLWWAAEKMKEPAFVYYFIIVFSKINNLNRVWPKK